MLTRRRALRTLATAAIGTAVTACRGSRTTSGSARLVLRHSRMPGASDPLPALLDGFERANPGVTVTREALPWTADVQHQFYVINLEARAPGFDVLMLDVIWIAEFARAGWLLDVTARWDPSNRAGHFPATVDAAMFDGRAWAVPWVANAGLLYYRRDLLEQHHREVPLTYGALADAARAIVAAEADPRLAGCVWQGKQYEGLVVNLLESFWASGADLLAPDGRLFPEEARARDALRFRRDLLRTGVSPSLVAAADEEMTRREFGAGRAVFLRNWPYALPLLDADGSPVRGRVAIAPLPGAGALGGAHLGISRFTRHPDAAWTLVEFLTRPETQRAVAAATGLHPTRPRLVPSGVLLDIFRRARPRPVSPWYQTISATLQPELSAVIAGVKSPEQAIGDARRRLEYFLHGTGA